jgi:hypothetical protein
MSAAWNPAQLAARARALTQRRFQERIAGVCGAELPDLAVIISQRTLSRQPKRNERGRNAEAGQQERHAARMEDRASRQNEESFGVALEGEAGRDAGGEGASLDGQPDGGGVRGQHEKIGCQGNHSCGQPEGQVEGEQSSSDFFFPFSPQAAREPSCKDTGGQHVKASRQAQRPARLRAPQQADGRRQGRFVEPDVAIQLAPVQHLDGGRHRQRFLRPQDAAVTKAEKRDGEPEDRPARQPVHARFTVCASRRSSVSRRPGPYSGSARANSTNVAK